MLIASPWQFMGWHAFGSPAQSRCKKSLQYNKRDFAGLFAIIIASCLIMIVHLSEVLGLVPFFIWKGALPIQSATIFL